MAGQCLAHALHQQAVAPVLQHGQGQGVLQHLLQGFFVAAQRQVQVAGIKTDAGLRGIKGAGAGEQHRVDRLVRWRGKRELRAQQGDARVHQPAGQAMDIAQHRDQAELAQCAQVRCSAMAMLAVSPVDVIAV